MEKPTAPLLDRLFQKPHPAFRARRPAGQSHFADALYVVFLAVCLALLSRT